MLIPSLFQLGDPRYLGIKKLTVGTTVVAHATSSNWATPADVVLNKQFIDASGALGTGTLENFGPLQTITVTAGTTATQLTAATSYRGFATITINPTPTMVATTTSSTTSQTIVAATGKFLSQVTINPIATVTRANTNMTATVNSTNNTITITAGNNQTTGYVTGSNATAQATVSLTINTPTLDTTTGKVVATAKAQFNNGATISKTSTSLDLQLATYSSANNIVNITQGYLASAAAIAIPTVARANTELTTSITTNGLVITAKNEQGTGYVVGSNATAQKTISLTTNGNEVTASDGTNSIKASVGIVSRANTTITATASNNKLLINASNNQATGYVVGSDATIGKEVTLTIGTPVLDADGKVRAVATITDDSSIPVKISKTSATLTLPSGDVTISGGTLTKDAGSVSATGTNIDLIATSDQPTSGYYITASGFGRVKRSDITKTNTPGYISAATATVLTGTSEVSNVATVYYTISTEEKTVTASTTAQVVEPSNGKLISKITINAIPVYDGSLEVQ